MKRIGTVVILTAILLMTACSRRDTGSSVADSGMTKIQNVDNSNGSKTDDQPEITQNADNRNGSKTEGWAEVSQNADNSNGSTTDDKAEVTQDIDSSIGNNADGAEGNCGRYILGTLICHVQKVLRSTYGRWLKAGTAVA